MGHVRSLLTIGELAARSGTTPATLRFYESRGLLSATRTAGGQRRYERAALRRVAFVRAAQQVGLTLAEVADALGRLPDGRTPTAGDWEAVSALWRDRLQARIDELVRLRDRLSDCIGCGCLSLERCGLQNPADRAASLGPGARYLLGDTPGDGAAGRAGGSGGSGRPG